MVYFLLVIAYLCGSIPFGLLFGRLKGIDVRMAGSGNIGATNVSRQLGKGMGFFTLAADALKAVVPMQLASWLLMDAPSPQDWVAFCGAAAVLGHLYPVYLRFRGGKGVATAFGMLLFLNAGAALVLAILFFIVVAISGFVSAGSLAAAAMMPIVWWFFGANAYQILVGILLSLLIGLKHRQNIGRLWRGEEKSWKRQPTTAQKASYQHAEK